MEKKEALLLIEALTWCLRYQSYMHREGVVFVVIANSDKKSPDFMKPTIDAIPEKVRQLRAQLGDQIKSQRPEGFEREDIDLLAKKIREEILECLEGAKNA